ncbi:hypothetical protein FRC03_010146 [Tulasnella sp. 419]|nr:hypothetical protein FRC03_010146 [Tulasnella sp. 419]
MKLLGIFFIFHLIWIGLCVSAAPISHVAGDDLSTVYEVEAQGNCLGCATSASSSVFERNLASRGNTISKSLLKARTLLRTHIVTPSRSSGAEKRGLRAALATAKNAIMGLFRRLGDKFHNTILGFFMVRGY